MPFVKGVSGNPNGRPKGAKDRLSELFLRDVLADWERHGTSALKAVRESDPASYCLMIVKLLPKDTTLNVSASQALLDALRAISEPALILGRDEPAGPLPGGPAGHA
jgi:hypothetical protein